MIDYKELDSCVAEYKAGGATKADTVVFAANKAIGWPYCWGASGRHLCTVSNRKMYMNNKKISSGDKELIRKRCQVLNGSKPSCANCVYYPNNIGVFLNDCQGFVKFIFAFVGISFAGGGATSMWNNAKNWEAKGPISTMPKDKVCCTFRDVDGTKEHILIYDGQGNYIHDSGEVKKQPTSKYNATHWAIPKGLYDEPVPPTPPSPTPPAGKAIVTGVKVALRQGPSKDTSVIVRVNTGTEVDIATVEGWTYVKAANITGFVMNQYIQDNGDTVTVTGKQLALRDGPSTSCRVRTRLATGQVVPKVALPTTWEYIAYGKNKGFMMKEYLNEG